MHFLVLLSQAFYDLSFEIAFDWNNPDVGIPYKMTTPEEIRSLFVWLASYEPGGFIQPEFTPKIPHVLGGWRI